MKKYLITSLFISVTAWSYSQVMEFSNPDLVKVKLERVSPALRDVPENPPSEKELNGPHAVHDNPSLEHPMQYINPDAEPKGADPALQLNYNSADERTSSVQTASNILSSWAGLTAAVEPSDNNIAVGPNHVMQMTNNSVSSYIRIWNKAGTVLVGNKLVSSITGITDYGDPNVLYDQLADRYLLVVLYSKSKKELVVCVSKTSDPTGSYYVYTFSTPNGFPDYPKIGVWGNSYFITTNSTSPTIYALNRSALLAGQSLGTAQVFSLSKFPTITFQSASPVSQTGATPPPANEPASVIRVADDAWGASVGPDHLELFNLSINWTNTALSTITGPIKLPTIPYNSNLCGYSSGSCIAQPHSTVKLDPLSDIVMDKVQYRNFGNYESFVCSHVCNADGLGTAGVRWYELRRNPNGSWYIYQQSTYAAGTDGRFMPSITINQNGTIALGYNISSNTVYPGIRITGRDSCDALNMMTVPESIIKTGAAANNSIRYGDYNGMVTDPVDGSFWFTGNYNPTPSWSTNVVHFTFTNCPALRETAPDNAMVNNFNLMPNPASTEVKLTFESATDLELLVQVFDLTGQLVISKMQPVSAGVNTNTLNIESLSNGYYFVKLSSEKGAASVYKLVVQR